MITKTKIVCSDGFLMVDSARYELNESQSINIYDLPESAAVGFEPVCNGYEVTIAKPLNELVFPFGHITRNSLIQDGWDFNKSPNPLCIIFNQKAVWKL